MGTHEEYKDCKIYFDGEPYDFDLQDIDVTCDYEEIKSHFPMESPVDMTAEFSVELSPTGRTVFWILWHSFQNNWRKQHGLPMIRRKALSHVHH